MNKIKNIPTILKSWIKTKVLGVNSPLFVEWNITFRCPYQCLYCGSREVSVNELDTNEILERLAILYKTGVRWITFGGGEPLIKKDIMKILEHAKSLGLNVFLSSTGVNIEKYDGIEKYIDHINLSFDGPEEIHDEIRGKGTYKRLFEVVQYCKMKNISTSFLCVISKLNINTIDFVLQKAQEEHTKVMFQPATLHLDSSLKPNPIAPDKEAYYNAMQDIIRKKKEGAPVRNSFAGLKYLSNWPHPTKIWCCAGRLTYTIEPDGTILSCHLFGTRELYKQKKDKDNGKDFENLITHLTVPTGCATCWCAPIVELALIWNLNPSAIWNALWI
ncbi:MAG TPA: radical SAM protein [Candidatus Hydrogenedens sp.]|nr:radical SAM protein [Candidatus Hydrogenedens sp.]